MIFIIKIITNQFCYKECFLKICQTLSLICEYNKIKAWNQILYTFYKIQFALISHLSQA